MLSIERNFVMNRADFNNKVIERFINSDEEDLTSCTNMLSLLNIISYNAATGCDNRYNLQKVLYIYTHTHTCMYV